MVMAVLTLMLYYLVMTGLPSIVTRKSVCVCGASSWLQFSTQRKVRATFISPQSPVFCLSTTNNHRAQAAQCSQLRAVFCLFFASLPLHGLLSYPDTGQQDEHSGTLREAVWNLFYEAHGKGRGRARQG